MADLNDFFITGNLGQDVKVFGKGDKITAKLSIASANTYTDNTGTKKEGTRWNTITILNSKIAKWASENLTKGSPVFVKGYLQDGSYEKDGEKVYTKDSIATRVCLFITHEDE